MKKYASRILLYLSVCLFILIGVSCNEGEVENTPPVISLKVSPQYTQNNDTVLVGSALKFGIVARSLDASITNFVIKKVMPDDSYTVVMDTGLYAMDLELEKVFYQNIEEEVDWTFSVMDKNRLTAEVSIKVFKDPNSKFGGIIYHPSITMGYQENTEFGQFLDVKAGKVYFQDSATIMQDNIDFLTYYIVDDDLPSPVFSSAGEYDNYSSEAGIFYSLITTWEKRKFTLWDISVDDYPISEELFNNCQNDSLIITEYEEVWGKKKFKWATQGRVIPFLTADGLKGLLKVNRADHKDDGSIEFAVKIQNR